MMIDKMCPGCGTTVNQERFCSRCGAAIPQFHDDFVSPPSDRAPSQVVTEQAPTRPVAAPAPTTDPPRPALTTARPVAPPIAGGDETRYARFLVRLMRGVVAVIVAGFILGGIGMGYGYAHRNDRSTEWVNGECSSSLNDDGTCGWKPSAGNVMSWSTIGGTAGFLGGLVATFGIETGIVVFLAARKYLRS